jgi:hypothetical protein
MYVSGFPGDIAETTCYHPGVRGGLPVDGVAAWVLSNPRAGLLLALVERSSALDRNVQDCHAICNGSSD